MEKSATSEKRVRYQLRILRPLLWWFILVLMLYGIRTHQRLMEKTRLNFVISMQGKAIDASASFDGKPILSGQNIPLGNHTFVITHPKGETYSTKMFIWYGGQDLGTIDLKRTMGTLSVSADPPARLLFLRGPEWSVTLTNSSGLTNSVPTDQYTVKSIYSHWERTDNITVFAGSTAPWRIAPRFGAVQLSCNQSDATFQLLAQDDRQQEEGGFPTLITELPVGNYQLLSQHHGHQRKQQLAVKAGVTNDDSIEFSYGAAVFETTPAGASVQDGDGHEWGLTPLRLPELLVGTWPLTIHLDGYEPVLLSLEVTANQTTIFRTNLISTSYTGEMKSARAFMARADYARALQAVGEALLVKPGDAEALTLQREATGRANIQRAKVLAQHGDYVGGGKELRLALQSLPDSDEARQLMADYKSHEPEQIERERVERLNRSKTVYEELSGQYPDADLFENHELKTTMPAHDAASAIARSLQMVQPNYKITINRSSKPETYSIVASQEDVGVITISGRRQCIIVCGQATDTETQIHYKVMEYKAKHNISMPALLAFKDDEKFIPIHSSKIPDMTDKLKAQVQAGVSNLTVRIQGAIGQTSASIIPQ